MTTQDHFGISVVEAMASGCAPVMHKSGGSWMDTLGQQRDLWFLKLNAIGSSGNIDMVFTHEDLSSKIASRVSQRA